MKKTVIGLYVIFLRKPGLCKTFERIAESTHYIMNLLNIKMMLGSKRYPPTDTNYFLYSCIILFFYFLSIITLMICIITATVGTQRNIPRTPEVCAAYCNGPKITLERFDSCEITRIFWP